MKNLIIVAIVLFFACALSSCAKKSIIKASSIAFSNSPFLAKSNLATAD